MKDPIRHCELYKYDGCAHVDGFLCDGETCKMRLEYVRTKEKPMSPFEPHHWREICKKVSAISTILLPHLNRKKIKSEVLSNLFETLSAEYFNSIGIPTQVATTDREPDLAFQSGPCEIKVTGVDKLNPKKCKWMGGKYSKRTSDYIFIMWNLSGDEMYFSVHHCYASENDWKTIDNGNENYYATVFESDMILERENKQLVGMRVDGEFRLEKFFEILGNGPRK
jgi:hypothetical protein